MQITAQAQFARNVERWQKLLADPELVRLPHRIETDRLGRIIMSPPPSLTHGSRQFRIARLLAELLPSGHVVTECPLSTADGVKAIDVAWLGPGRTEIDAGELVLESAPEICVEILSPSNTAEEMAEKQALYFEAGAQEVWICELDGRLSFYCGGDLCEDSEMCSLFPKQI
jgi:Uma2 family endonuclease